MSGGARQLPLELPHRPALDRADFLVTPANELAVAWIDHWPEWPQPALVLHGPEGSGKTHLTRVWQRRANATVIDLADLARDLPTALQGDVRAAVVEDVGTGLTVSHSPEGVARGLLHLYNLVAERGGHLLLTDTLPAKSWPVPLPDLASRLGAATQVALGAPDDTLLAAVMVKLFADRQLTVPPDVVQYLLPRIERSFAAVRGVVAALDRAALARRQAITVPLAREVLSNGVGDDENGYMRPTTSD
jgi:chromosomal replication initiation ATPase DnaA